jgi:cytochrome c oxidase cbb3-type subunit 1
MTYDDRPVKWMVYPAICFLVIGMAMGVFLAFNAFVFPDFFSGAFIHFGRMRPVHVSHVTLLWLLSINVGLMYFFVPRLCGRPLWSAKLAAFTAWLWWPMLILGVYSFPFGTNSGWEYAELPTWIGWLPVKPLFTIAWLCVAINLLVTIFTRKHKQMYVSLWYVMGTLIWTTFTWTIGNFGLTLVPGGMARVNMNYFYVHNLVGLIFTPMGVAAAYYFIPKLTKSPLYSHKLSLIGFWSIAFVYSWVGAHHIIHGPMSQWLQTTAIVFSLWLFVPVWTVIVNFFLTMSGKWHTYSQNPGIRFLMMGTVFYLLVCIQGPLQGLRNVNEITSKTDWVVSHAHFALYGTFSFFALGGLYYVIPAITGKQWWSERLGNWHFGLNMLGAFPFLLALMIGGYLQGTQWANWANGSTYAAFHHNLAQNPFLQTVASMHPWWLLRALGGVMILTGNALFAVNVFNTAILSERAPYEAVSTG